MNKYREAKEGNWIYSEAYPNEQYKHGDVIPAEEYRSKFNPSKEAAKQVAKGNQVGGKHYVSHTIQPWDIIDEYKLDYYLGNSIKYILRSKTNQVEDIKKAIHYLEYWVEVNA